MLLVGALIIGILFYLLLYVKP